MCAQVDAALDLSHTQNIGRMIRTHFPYSQFIVVSLKEGMFSNANVIFRTKFVDGVSTVTRSANDRKCAQKPMRASCVLSLPPVPAVARLYFRKSLCGNSRVPRTGVMDTHWPPSFMITPSRQHRCCRRQSCSRTVVDVWKL